MLPLKSVVSLGHARHRKATFDLTQSSSRWAKSGLPLNRVRDQIISTATDFSFATWLCFRAYKAHLPYRGPMTRPKFITPLR